MPSIEEPPNELGMPARPAGFIHRFGWQVLVGAAGLSVLGGCSQPAASAPGTSPDASANTSIAAAPPGVPGHGTPAGPGASRSVLPLPAPRPVGSWDDVRRQAAHRIVAANPGAIYLGPVPDPLLAIPVLEIELKRDGSIARILILRAPRQAKDTSELAIAAVRRAAPFGDISRLPRPWRFTETFLFDEQRKFKPRTLDE